MGADREIPKRSEFRFSQVVLKLAMNDVDRFEREVAATDPGLVGYDEEVEPECLKELKCFQCVRKVLNILGPREVVFI